MFELGTLRSGCSDPRTPYPSRFQAGRASAPIAAKSTDQLWVANTRDSSVDEQPSTNILDRSALQMLPVEGILLDTLEGASPTLPIDGTTVTIVVATAAFVSMNPRERPGQIFFFEGGMASGENNPPDTKGAAPF